jgi:hypothetical protein
MVILSGCATNGTAEALTGAATAKGTAAAGIDVPRQPRECREEYELLPRGEVVGQQALILVDRYEQFITGTVNPTKRRCFQFNDNIRSGLARSAR